ncbi:hypothetical protein EDB19DRAFT_1943677 [Suillus lakei]|nr:hypothetical protein EDB19DRAFT_1943677 [Suillus lakei]
MNGFFDSEISSQGCNKPLNYNHITHSALSRANAGPSSSSRSFNVRTFFDGVQPSSDRGKQKAPEVVDVPLGQATYQDVVGVDDGTRPYELDFFCCLRWFQKKKKEKKPDPPRPVYDDELEDDESEEGIPTVPIPTTCVQPARQEDIELNPMTKPTSYSKLHTTFASHDRDLYCITSWKLSCISTAYAGSDFDVGTGSRRPCMEELPAVAFFVLRGSKTLISQWSRCVFLNLSSQTGLFLTTNFLILELDTISNERFSGLLRCGTSQDSVVFTRYRSHWTERWRPDALVN